MQTLVIYDTKFANTEKIARAIALGASELSTVRVMDGGQVALPLTEQPDLLLIGGPTQKRSMSPGLRDVVEGLVRGGLRGIATASFDTRYRGSTLFMGSAAVDAAKRLQKAGARLATTAESFFIGRGGPLERQTLEAGEVERAAAWGRSVAAALTGGSES